MLIHLVVWVTDNGVISQIPPGDGKGVHRVDPTAGRGGNWRRIEGTIVGIRQFAVLHRQKMLLNNISTCCEGQATRALGSLPEYIFSFAGGGSQTDDGNQTDAVYINLFADATVSLMSMPSLRAAATGKGEKDVVATPAIRMATAWPYSSNVNVLMILPKPVQFTLMLRIPTWVANESVRCAYRFDLFASEVGIRKQICL